MADKKDQLPNLKICIDNTGSDKEEDDVVSIHEDDDIVDSPVYSDNEDERNVEFNVRIGKRVGKPKSQAFRQPSKVYENKAGDFVTGIDVTEKGEVRKKSERAKRFGLEEKKGKHSVDLKGLYKSFGFNVEDLHKDHRGIRLEAVHFRGVEHMHTKDIFKYFQEFGPGGVEWIDDSSCNVVWMDNLTAARAMLDLSRSYDEIVKPYEADASESDEEKDDKDKGTKSKVKKKRKKKASSDEDERKEEKMEEDEDVLDLLDESDAAKLTQVNGNKTDKSENKQAGLDKEKEKPKSPTKTKKKVPVKKKPSQSSSSSSSSSSLSSSGSGSSSSSNSSSSSSSSSSSGSSSSSSGSSSSSSSSSSSDSSSDEDMDTSAKDKAKKKDDKSKSEEITTSSKTSSDSKKTVSKPEKSETKVVNKKLEESSDNKDKSTVQPTVKETRQFPPVKPSDIPWPPGRWRLGLPYKQTKYLFLRYATKADKKLPGAEKRSKFYVRHGNPNYSGMKGFISSSRKRKLRNQQYREEIKEAKEAVAVQTKRDAVTYDDFDMFSDNVKMDTEHTTDFGTSTADARKVEERLGQVKALDDSDMEEGELDARSDNDDLDLLADKRRFEYKPVDPEALEMQKELDVLLKSPPKKRPMMKMYADELEEEVQAKKKRHSGLTITTDTRSEGDARSLIVGRHLDIDSISGKPKIDLRSKLKRNRTPSWDI